MNNVIYKIINIQNQKFYVGSTTQFEERMRVHKKRLRSGKHHSQHLQAAWNKYGEAAFIFVVVERVSGDLQAAEDVWLRQHVGHDYCYNVSKYSDAPMRGRVGALHPAFGTKLSGKRKSAMSADLLVRYASGPESHPRFGIPHTAEARAKTSAHRRGKAAGEKHYRFGQTVSDEVRQKIGDTQRGKPKAPGRKLTELGKAKIRAAAEAGHYATFKGKHHTEETKKLMGAAIIMLPSGKRFDTITEMRAATGMGIALVQRSLKTDKAISKGPFAGASFQYQDPEREAARLQRAAELAATRPKAKIGRPAGSGNESQMRVVRELPSGREFLGVNEYARQTGTPRSAVYKMLAGKVRDGLTLVYV